MTFDLMTVLYGWRRNYQNTSHPERILNACKEFHNPIVRDFKLGTRNVDLMVAPKVKSWDHHSY